MWKMTPKSAYQNDSFSSKNMMGNDLLFSTFYQKRHLGKPFQSVDNLYGYTTSVSCSFNGKEKDYESGFHYYGARYYWSELLTGWLSVDPMADKYPSISPYAYCAWNPVKLVDPDGRDFKKKINHEDKTITISAEFLYRGTNEQEQAFVNKAVDAWNACSFVVSLPGENGAMENYTVSFNINNGDGPINEVEFMPNEKYDTRFRKNHRSGALSDGKSLTIRNSVTNNQLIAHEMGHCLGMSDNELIAEGLMFRTNTGKIHTKMLGPVERMDLLSACGFNINKSNQDNRTGQCVKTNIIGNTPAGFFNVILKDKNLISHDTKKFVQ